MTSAPFGRVPASLLPAVADMHGSEVAVAFVLAIMLGKRDTITTTWAELGAVAGVGRTTLFTALTKLRDRKAITWERERDGIRLGFAWAEFRPPNFDAPDGVPPTEHQGSVHGTGGFRPRNIDVPPTELPSSGTHTRASSPEKQRSAEKSEKSRDGRESHQALKVSTPSQVEITGVEVPPVQPPPPEVKPVRPKKTAPEVARADIERVMGAWRSAAKQPDAVLTDNRAAEIAKRVLKYGAEPLHQAVLHLALDAWFSGADGRANPPPIAKFDTAFRYERLQLGLDAWADAKARDARKAKPPAPPVALVKPSATQEAPAPTGQPGVAPVSQEFRAWLAGEEAKLEAARKAKEPLGLYEARK